MTKLPLAFTAEMNRWRLARSTESIKIRWATPWVSSPQNVSRDACLFIRFFFSWAGRSHLLTVFLDKDLLFSFYKWEEEIADTIKWFESNGITREIPNISSLARNSQECLQLKTFLIFFIVIHLSMYLARVIAVYLGWLYSYYPGMLSRSRSVSCCLRGGSASTRLLV